ncbi:serine/threonine protein kinase [Corynebacterium pseudopelargi]|uniref:non-specific serine/threonine protein kinase n=1 Tax=Corynebacterium pseudopelargi TaxID=2080757 RepID=A0A3G6IS51_9CORY|nr:serine/threonine protein kinase [Corynebacterium pseudopelargi]AZA08422.1 Serine/threonine-protein kinase PknG [Corynebacterium pseudopelargi]
MTEPHTEAVPFDPFADDEDDLTGIVAELQPEDYRAQVGIRAREQALSTFRSQSKESHSDRTVANGMVTLPFIPLIPLEDALKEPGEPAPQLSAGDVVAGQYEIAGVIGHGGMGYIYLANDRNVSGRMVVLKGIRAQAEAQQIGAAEAEREFLASISHPEIVKAYNFVDDPRVGGLIVMEYVPGPSLSSQQQNQENGVFSLDVAIGYILEILPALEYLHSRGVLYNDLKPDNIILTEDQVMLIDLGAVSGIGAFGYIYGTKGFQAPEVATEGPSVASDIFTIGRTLASMVVHMPKEDGVMQDLPTPDDEPLFAHNMSLYRLLRRATDPDPKERFQDVRTLETQLYGVLREFLAVHRDEQFPAQHSLYSPQRSTFGTKHLVYRTDQLIDGIERSVKITSEEINAALPVPLLDRSDPGASLISGSSYSEPSEALETMRQAMNQEEFATSKEIPLAVVRSLLDLGFIREARSWLEKLDSTMDTDWRHIWYSGITHLLLDDYAGAQHAFNEVYNVLPGEPAPKLARAAVSELLLQDRGKNNTKLLDSSVALAAANLEGEAIAEVGGTWRHLASKPEILRFKAIYLYALVWKTNPTTVSSAFGLARQLMAEQQVDMAVATLDSVSPASTHYRMAELTAILHLISGELTESRIRRAARRIEAIPNNEARFLQIKVAVLNAGLNWLREHQLDAAAAASDLLGYPFTQRGLQVGLYESLRTLARSAPNAHHRYALADMANKVRPMTWF